MTAPIMSANDLPQRLWHLRLSGLRVAARSVTGEEAHRALREQIEILGTRDRRVENRIQVLPHAAVLKRGNVDEAGDWPASGNDVGGLARVVPTQYGVDLGGLALGAHVQWHPVDPDAAGKNPDRQPRRDSGDRDARLETVRMAWRGQCGANGEDVYRGMHHYRYGGGGRHETKRQERGRRRREFILPVIVQHRGVIGLEIINLG